MATIADKIHHRFISHAVDISRFEVEVMERALIFLKMLDGELAKDISDNLELGFTQQRLKSLKAQVRATIATAYSNAEDAVNDGLKGLGAVEQAFTLNAVNQSIGADLLTTSLTPEKLQTLVDKTKIFGRPSQDWWADQTRSLQEKFMVEMQMGIARGETIGELIMRIRGQATLKKFAFKTRSGKRKVLVEYRGGIMDIHNRHAAALIRTGIQSVSNNVRQKTFESNSDVVKGQAWLSTLDTRTTPICQALDGLEWDLNGNPLGGHSEPFNPPPAHWNCRSTIVPLLKSWEELSKTKSPDLKRKISKVESEIPLSTRSSLGGPVSSKMNYTGWFNRQSETVQVDILGKRKLELFKKGKLSFRDMVDQTGNPLTIQELEQKVFS
jgi:SPP1 gp7 family putative phage head morphogenesis protein